MTDKRRDLLYEYYKNNQIAQASADDLILIMAEDLVRMKDETGMNLFWDEDEEAILRAYIKSPEKLAQS
jgi:hypothetical protein